MGSSVFHFIDLIGTFAFAISGALAAINRNLDIFGIFVVAFITACGGGVLRDICLGSFPPAGMINLQYFIVVALAVFLSAFFQKLLLRLTQPTLFFDAIGLGFLHLLVYTKPIYLLKISNFQSLWEFLRLLAVEFCVMF